MSPAAKSKSKEKASAKDRKASSKRSATNGGTSASAYNPISGTFHMLESVIVDSGDSSHNGRFRTIDDIENSSGSIGMNTDYDSVSNNGSCSGESEDPSHHGKEKTSAGKLGIPPGMVGGNDKRERIRNKNEKKHQRQKERRTQELRDRCTGYLMSRKLEALSQQLVAMGFSSELSTMALILNEGRVEKSVAWLLEGGQVKEDLTMTDSLKIDISEELTQIAAMEIRYKCSRTEIERAVVAAEGDLEKAAALFQNRWQNMSPSKIEDNDGISGTNDKRDAAGNGKGQPAVPVQTSRTASVGHIKHSTMLQAPQQQRQEGKDFNYVKGMSQSHPPGGAAPEGNNKNFQLLRSSRPKSEVQKSPPAAEKKMPVSLLWPPSSSAPSVSYSLSNSVQFPTPSRTSPAKIQQRTILDGKTVQVQAREPGTATQRQHSPFTTQALSGGVGFSSSSTPTVVSSAWNGGTTAASTPPSFQHVNVTASDEHLKTVAGGRLPVQSSSRVITGLQGQLQPLLSNPMDSVGAGWSTGITGLGPYETHLLSPSLGVSSLSSRNSVPTSLGLFTGWSSGLSGSSADWNMGPMAHCDYTNIDWSVAASPSNSLNFSMMGLSSGFSSMVKRRDSVNSEWSLQPLSVASSPSNDITGNYEAWLGSKLSSSTSGIVLQDRTLNESGSATTSFGVHEWTSPFAGKDLFSLPRQLVLSPSL